METCCSPLQQSKDGDGGEWRCAVQKATKGDCGDNGKGRAMKGNRRAGTAGKEGLERDVMYFLSRVFLLFRRET